jgi:hypothetical protein
MGSPANAVPANAAEACANAEGPQARVLRRPYAGLRVKDRDGDCSRCRAIGRRLIRMTNQASGSNTSRFFRAPLFHP